MTHQRTTIRNALVSRLTGLTTCGAHVYGSRLKPLLDSELPAILVSTDGEEIDSYTTLTTNRVVGRCMRCRLEIVVKALNGFETTVDTALAEIENALFDTTAHNNLGGAALSTSLAGIGDIEVDYSIEKPVCRLPVVLEVNYLS